MTRVRRVRDVCTIALFALGITLPMLGSVVGGRSPTALGENRMMTPLPVLALDPLVLAAFPARFDAAYADRFGFRGHLIRWHNLVKTRWLGQSPSEKVVFGQQGWLYYAGERTMEDYRASEPFTSAALADWQATFEARHEWLAQRGIHYLLVVAPNAQTIYPEYVPAAYDRVGSISRLDQLIAQLQAHTGVTIVDVRDALRDAKRRERVYFRTDSHWNERGALVAYQEIITALQRWYPDMVPMPREAFEEDVSEEPGGDLASMIGMQDVMREEHLLLRPRLPLKAQPAVAGMTTPGFPLRRQPRAFETGRPDLPRAVMHRDSFGNALVPLLSEHFQRILYLFTRNISPDVIGREHPQVVIQELVERRLMGPPLLNDAEITSADGRSAAR